MNYKEERPWGTFEILYDGDECKVKKIVVYPDQRLSLQSHKQRDETWIPVSGYGQITLDENTYNFGYVPLYEITGSTTRVIPRGKKHRVVNDSNQNLVFIEVQTGDYFGEDDIIRYEDDYGRLNKEEEDV